MKALFRVCVFFALCITATASPTAFTYQGNLSIGGAPAQGIYDLEFSVFTSETGTNRSGPVNATSVTLTNGSSTFTVMLDFGTTFYGEPRWLEIAARTNNDFNFTILTPRQELRSVPYATMAYNASNLLGTLPATQLSGKVSNAQLSSNSITITAGTGLGGGGVVTLGGVTTLSNTGVRSVTGNSDITASPTNGAVVLTTTGTSTNSISTLVKRDSNGSFAATSITLTGNLTLPAPTPTTGIIMSGTNTLVSAYGTQNFFAGPMAGNSTLTGTLNTGIGNNALRNVSSGGYNTAVGAQSLYQNTSGGFNTAVGDWSLGVNISGSYNTAVGHSSLTSNQGGSQNTAIGYSSLYSNSSGTNNTASGYYSLANNVTGNKNTANGHSSLYLNKSGFENTAVGFEALYSNTNGTDNTALGTWALYANTSGFENTACGVNTLRNNTVGTYNTASGHAALFYNTVGIANTANGFQSLNYNTNGNYNTANGINALWANTTGSFNTSVGGQSLHNNTLGSNNVAIGYAAGYNLTTGHYNIDIANQGIAGDNATIRIGTTNVQTNTFIAGIYGATAASGVAVYVDANGQLGTLTSSKRYKQDIEKMDAASEALYALNPVTFRYKSEIDPKGLSQFGLIAEEVDKVDPNLVAHDDQHGIYTVRYEAVNAMLLNEFLKEHRKVEAQSTELKALKEENVSLAERLQQLEATVKALAEKR